MRKSPPFPNRDPLLVKAFLIDPHNPHRSDGLIAKSAPALELLALAHNTPLGGVVHDHKEYAGMVCLDGVRSLEYFEGAFSEFQSIVRSIFPLRSTAVILELPSPDRINLTAEQIAEVVSRYALENSQRGLGKISLFEIIQRGAKTQLFKCTPSS